MTSIGRSPRARPATSRSTPPGFALECFDVLGGFRETYRALGDQGEKVEGFGKNGQPFRFRAGLPVDASARLPDGRAFHDVREMKRLLLADERRIARALLGQFVAHSTGAPARFGDRDEAERILDSAGPGFGVRSRVRAMVQSELFRNK